MALVRKDRAKELRASVVVPPIGKKDDVAIENTVSDAALAGGRDCRLKCNMIIDRKLIARDQVINDSLVPEKFRTEEYVDYEDLGGKEGKVLVLLQIVYSGRPSLDGASYPVTVIPGDVIVLDDIPASARELLVEGVHYQSEFTDVDVARVKHEEQAKQDKFFNMKGSTQVGGFWRK